MIPQMPTTLAPVFVALAISIARFLAILVTRALVVGAALRTASRACRGSRISTNKVPCLTKPLLVGFWFVASAAVPGTPLSGERAALLELYESTGGPGWLDNAGWNSSASVCDWYGVSCDSTGTSLTHL